MVSRIYVSAAARTISILSCQSQGMNPQVAARVDLRIPDFSSQCRFVDERSLRSRARLLQTCSLRNSVGHMTHTYIMTRTNHAAVIAAGASLGAGWIAMERVLHMFESERIRLGIDSDEYAWRVLSAAASSVASAAFWMSSIVHFTDIADHDDLHL